MKRETEETLEQGLARIGASTAALRPRGGYNDRVMRAVQAARGASVFDGMLRAARGMVPVAVMAAALAMGWAVHNDRAADLALASNFDGVVLE